MARSACALVRQACTAQVLVESSLVQHGGAGHAAQLTSKGVCHSTTVESEEAVRIRVSCAGLKRACHTQWDWRPSWSRGCGVAPLPRALQRSGQRLLSQLGQHRQGVQARAGQSVLGCWRCRPGTWRLAGQAAEWCSGQC